MVEVAEAVISSMSDMGTSVSLPLMSKTSMASDPLARTTPAATWPSLRATV